MVELTREQAPGVEELFGHTDETLILSFVQGHHGRGWADCVGSLRCVQVVVGDFCYFAGDSSLPEAEELVRNRIVNWSIAVPQNGEWGALISRVYGENCRRSTRYQFRHRTRFFDGHHLRRLTSGMPPEYRIVPIDAELYERLLEHELTRDYISNFCSCEDYLARGLGFCALSGKGELAGGASSYTTFDGGIEIEISTMPRHRRRGVAAACAAALILECSRRRLTPSWDAANPKSRALAEKLGFDDSYEYDVYRIEGEPI